MHANSRERDVAKEQGLKLYYTGKPCKNGHTEWRRVSSGSCLACEKLIGKKHRDSDKHKEWYKTYSRSDRFKNTQRRYYESEKGKETWKRINSSEDRKAARAAWGRSERGRLYRQADSGRRRVQRRGLKGSVSAEEFSKIINLQKCRCYYCKAKFSKENKATIDHIIALIVGGIHHQTNIVAACKSCNSRKNKRRINPITGQGLLL